jgi:hypothetical protein
VKIRQSLTGPAFVGEGRAGFSSDPAWRITYCDIVEAAGRGIEILPGRGAGLVAHTKITGCSAEGLFNQAGDMVFDGVDIGSVGKEGMVLAGGSGRAVNCKVFFCGLDPTYKRGAAYVVTNMGNTIESCHAQDSDGPALMILANGVKASLWIDAACNLTGVSGWLEQNPIRGGGFAAGKIAKRSAVLVAADGCSVNVTVTDRGVVRGDWVPQLQCFVEMREALNNVVTYSALAPFLASGAIVDAVMYTRMDQAAIDTNFIAGPR